MNSIDEPQTIPILNLNNLSHEIFDIVSINKTEINRKYENPNNRI
jgi:hypothetical protein